jgi:hypothetical protein
MGEYSCIDFRCKCRNHVRVKNEQKRNSSAGRLNYFALSWDDLNQRSKRWYEPGLTDRIAPRVTSACRICVFWLDRFSAEVASRIMSSCRIWAS